MDLVETQHGENLVFTARVIGADLSATPGLMIEIPMVSASPGHERLVYGLALTSDDGKAWVQIIRQGNPPINRGWFKLGAGVPYIRQMAPPFSVSILHPGEGLALGVSAEGQGDPSLPNLGVHVVVHSRKYQQNPTAT